jgi:hypothetical protein
LSHYDIFNGDADGIFALAQLRKSDPKDSKLITGPKRDINLLRSLVDINNSTFTVLDISLEKNLEFIPKCIENNNIIDWTDHHRPGKFPTSNQLKTTIDTSPNVCTSILIDHRLNGEQRAYAIAGAYGDNLHKEAETLGREFSREELNTLKEVGEVVNYNGYGETLNDLNAHPKELYLDIMSYSSIFEFANNSELYKKIKNQKDQDTVEMNQTKVIHSSESGKCVLLPDSKASSRMSGIYSNELVFDEPNLAHAIFTTINNGKHYRISIRAPLNNPANADKLAAQFPDGGGRAKAAGINQLNKNDLDNFFTVFDDTFEC